MWFSRKTQLKSEWERWGPAGLLVEFLLLNSIQRIEYLWLYTAKIWTLWRIRETIKYKLNSKANIPTRKFRYQNWKLERDEEDQSKWSISGYSFHNEYTIHLDQLSFYRAEIHRDTKKKLHKQIINTHNKAMFG